MRCPHLPTAVKIAESIRSAREKKDSLGGVVQGCVYGMPQGLGEPVFDKVAMIVFRCKH